MHGICYMVFDVFKRVPLPVRRKTLKIMQVIKLSGMSTNRKMITSFVSRIFEFVA